MTETAPAVPTLETSLDIDAPPERVWALISDLTNMPRWSPQVRKTIVKGGETKQGATMWNINRRKLLFWPTQAKVVAFEPGRKLAFRIKENYTIWSFTLEPLEGGRTRVTERREAPQGISNVSTFLIKTVLGGQETFVRELREGMAQTLRLIAAEV